MVIKLLIIKAHHVFTSIISFCVAFHEKLKEHIKDVGVAQSKQVPLFWCGMAEVI